MSFQQENIIMSAYFPGRRHLMLGALVLMLQSGTAAFAAPAAPMAEVTSLAGLPAQIRADLGADDKTAMSDRGGPFNPGCIMVAGEPSQRFMLAAVGADTAVVAVEYGGIAHGATSHEYRHANGKWTLVSHGAPGLHLAGREDLLAQHARSALPVTKR